MSRFKPQQFMGIKREDSSKNREKKIGASSSAGIVYLDPRQFILMGFEFITDPFTLMPTDERLV